MDTAINYLKAVYSEIKQHEWKTVKQDAPKALKKLPWSADHVFLLHQLRYYVRIKVYREMFNDNDYSWDKDHYKIFRQLLSLREAHVLANSVLEAYKKTLDVAIAGVNSAGAATEIREIMTFVRVNKYDFSREDWVDIYSMLGNLCTGAINSGLSNFVRLGFIAHAHQIEGKYGFSWNSRKDPPLPSNMFMNIISLALKGESNLSWSSMPIEMIDTTSQEMEVSDWLHLFIKKYKSRLAPGERSVYVNFAKAKIAFHNADFFETDKHLRKGDKSKVDLFNLDLERLRMINSYEAAHIVGKSKRHLLARRDFNTKSAPRINRFRSQLSRLRKERKYQQQVEHFTWFINGFALLFGLHKQYPSPIPVPRGIIKEEVETLRSATPNVSHPVKEWLLNKLNEKAG